MRSSYVNRALFGISTSADPCCSLQRLPRRTNVSHDRARKACNARNAAIGLQRHCGTGNVAGGSSSGGILLLQLACTEPHGFTDAIGSFGTLVKTRWTDAHGRPHSHEELVTFRFSEGGWYSHPAIRKAMALVRYVDAQSEYILDDRDASENLESTARADPLQLASWRERHERYANQFESLRAELLGEMMVVGDASLEEVAGVVGSGSNRSVLQVSGPPPL